MPAPKLAQLLLISLASTLVACGGEQSSPSSSQGALRIVTPNLPPAYLGDSYSAQLRSEGGVRPHTFKLEGTLPKGVTFTNGTFSGTPQEKGNFELTAFIEDASLSRNFQKLTLSVLDPLPPKVALSLPQSETSDPFLMAVRLEGRESRAFHAQFVLKDLKAAMETFKAAEGLLYVLRYDAERSVLDLDAAWVTPRKDLEVFRLSLTPLKALRPLQQMAGGYKAAFYDKNGNLFTQADAFTREPSQGQYGFETLLLIAQNWGKKLQSAQQPPPAQEQPAQPAQPEGQGGEQSRNPGPKAQEPPAPEGQNTSPAKPTPPPQTLPGDLNQDKVVDAKDLEILRASYAWKSVGNPTKPDKKESSPAQPKPGEATPQDTGNPEEGGSSKP
ncbi:putative Ig domain-containing protein [Calidithermus timidus]|jgi:hypothetical protein|uniref:putative Ig domain-containing protein n=1 Tax=Calidithermus timidus TaxID=307124 RepID=UPI00037EF2F0|nr:putative Ig domain-containing protein [Calidithermus timidus]